MNRRSWIRVVISLSPEEQDLLIGRLGLIGFEGFQQDGRALHSFIPKDRWKVAQNELTSLLLHFRRQYTGPEIEFTANLVREQNWNKKWEASMGIVEATKHIVIRPSWKRLRAKDRGKLAILIDPKMSFGTGHHESTKLSLALLDRYLKPGVRVMDFGCGSGILSIAAAKLGARSVFAIDNDVWAVSNAKENIRKNAVSKKVRVVRGDLAMSKSKKFDLIVANIDFPTIVQSLATLYRTLQPNGILILSGILKSDHQRIEAVLKMNGLRSQAALKKNEWIALSVVKS